MRNLTAEQKEKTEARRAAFANLVKQISEMTAEQRALIVENTGVIITCEGHALSAYNSCLILFQLPTASIVGGFRQWHRCGRSVQKGQIGLRIFIPISVNESENPTDADDLRFIMGTVFDLTQTQEIESAKIAA